MNIPSIVNMFNVYKTDGNKFIGVSDEVTLPDMEAITSTISGPGILGEIDVAAIGQFGNQTFEIPFRSFVGDLTELLNPAKSVGLTLRISQEELDGEGNIKHVGLRVVVRGMPSAMTSGSVKQGQGTGSSVSLNLTYYLLEYDGKPVLELDKLNSVYKVNGVDVLAAARALC